MSFQGNPGSYLNYRYGERELKRERKREKEEERESRREREGEREREREMCKVRWRGVGEV